MPVRFLPRVMAAAGTTVLVAASLMNCSMDRGGQIASQVSEDRSAATEFSAPGSEDEAERSARDGVECDVLLGNLLSAGQVEFAAGSDSILPSSGPLLDRLVPVVRACPRTVLIEGHTDNRGARDENQLLSLERAEAVLEELVARGVARSHLIAVGMGSNDPVASNTTPEGRSANRRIEFSLSVSAN